jgi:hypothetical protein
MNPRLAEKLKQISDLINPGHVQNVEALQEKIWTFEKVDRIPVMMMNLKPLDYELYPYDETFDHPEKMMWNELISTYVGAALQDDRIYTIRANYGPAIVPSLFGSKITVDRTTTWIESAHDQAVIRQMVSRGMPEINAHLAAKALETQSLFRSCLEEYNISQYVHVVQTDTQGPFDIAEMIWGTEIYYAMYDEPDLVHAFLDLVTETIIAYIKLQKSNIKEKANEMYHWWYKVPGGARIVDDVTTTLSPAMYKEFVKPYNERIFKAFGNGYMHYCGHTLQNQALRLDTDGIVGIEMAGANLADPASGYDLETIWKSAYDQNVVICWFGPGMPEKKIDLPSGLIVLCYDAEIAENSPYFSSKEYYQRAKDFWRFTDGAPAPTTRPGRSFPPDGRPHPAG